MIEKYGLFDSLEGDEREYAEADLALLVKALSADGIRGGQDALKVSPAPSGLGVTVAAGFAIVQGRYYALEDDGAGTKTFTLTTASANPRIDRIVLRLDFAQRTVKLDVLKGREAAAPEAPELIRNTTEYMLSLAQVRIGVGAALLTTDNITDERADMSLCGLYAASADEALAAAGEARAAANTAQTTADAAKADAAAAQSAANEAKTAANSAQSTADGKAPTSHASSAATYGAASGSNYGHVRLSDSTSSTSSTGGGYAATPAAVKAAYDLASAANSKSMNLTMVEGKSNDNWDANSGTNCAATVETTVGSHTLSIPKAGYYLIIMNVALNGGSRIATLMPYVDGTGLGQQFRTSVAADDSWYYARTAFIRHLSAGSHTFKINIYAVQQTRALSRGVQVWGVG